MITFKTTVAEKATVVEFILGDGGVCAPADLVGMKVPEVDGTKGVVLTGRGPIWLYGALVHCYHATAWVATNDPRLGAVVVQSHHEGVTVGDVIPV